MKRYQSEGTEVREHLVRFTKREEALIKRIGDHPIPEYLLNWRHWIGDSVVYLNGLRNLADEIERKEKQK